MEKSSVISVDLAKSVFQVAVGREDGRKAEQFRLSRAAFLQFFANREAGVVVLEACGSAHHWARELAKLGHRPVLLPAQHVRPYVRGNKTDRTDALGLLEAYRHAALTPVPVKSLEHQAITLMHRLRSGWMQARRARLNQIRGVLREFGVTIPVGAKHVLPRLRALWVEQPCPVPVLLHELLRSAAQEIEQLEERIAEAETQLKRLARSSPEMGWLMSVPGIGLLTATALVASLGSPQRFATGRHLGSFLGLTPRESSSAERRRQGRITKRGDGYLRCLLVHGARTVLRHAPRHKNPDRLRSWALRLVATRGKKTATVALANKMARLAWAVWSREQDYQAQAA